jgi:hypothetical protein
MGIFRRKSAGGRLPVNFVEQLAIFGQHQWSVYLSPYESAEIWTSILEPFLPAAKGSPAAFVEVLAIDASPVGGWTAYGAERLMHELVDDASNYEGYATVLDASLEFLRRNYVKNKRLTGFEWKYWVDSGGTVDSWIPSLPVPDITTTLITPLSPGESRRVAQLESRTDSNAFYVSADSEGFIVEAEARWNDEDPTRKRWKMDRAESMFDLYLDLAYQLESVYWSDQELKPFFPIPPCTLPL